MNTFRSPNDGNTYFFQGGDLYFVESTFENRSLLIEGDFVPDSALPEEESELTETQLNVIKYNLGAPSLEAQSSLSGTRIASVSPIQSFNNGAAEDELV